MSEISRRQLIATGLTVAAGTSGVVVAAKLARRHGLIPPDAGGFYGPGETLTYAAQRLLSPHAMAREFSRDQISTNPFANEVDRLGDEFRRIPTNSQITMIGCEEGWTYIAEWTGAPLSYILDRVGVLPQVRYVVYRSFQPDWWESIDMADALHPQTVLAHGMNGSELPVPFGGPVRLRVPRQLGYKSVKYITRLTLTDNLKTFGKGTGGANSDGGYAWYAGI
jgi:hypothetical protein